MTSGTYRCGNAMQFDQRTIFPDTNIFLHFPPLDQIDWIAVAGAAKVELVICLQVLSELDAKKSDARFADRAARSLRQIRELRDKTVRDGVILSVFNEQVRGEDFPPDMDPEMGDDRILRQVQRFVEKNPEKHVAVVTADYGMELRCEALSVDALNLAPELRLSVPEDERQKKYRQVVEEAQRLKNKRPDLSVIAVPRGTEEPQSVECFEMELSRNPSLLDVNGEAERIRTECSLFGPTNAEVMEHPVLPITTEKREQYNERVREFYEKHDAFVHARNSWQEAEWQTIRFDLWLDNQGTEPADDVYVRVEFPSLFSALERVDVDEPNALQEPISPTPPKRPETTTQSILKSVVSAGSFGMMNTAGLPILSSWDPNIASVVHDPSPSVDIRRKSNGDFDVTVEVHRLKHLFLHRLGSFAARFSGWGQVHPFTAGVLITAANLPDRCDQTLVFKVDARQG